MAIPVYYREQFNRFMAALEKSVTTMDSPPAEGAAFWCRHVRDKTWMHCVLADVQPNAPELVTLRVTKDTYEWTALKSEVEWLPA